MIIVPETLNDPAWLLLSLGGLLTLVTSVLMALNQFRLEARGSGRESGEGSALQGETGPATPWPRTFVFVGFVALPVMIGGFWGRGARARWLGALYWLGLALAAGGAFLLLLRRL